jgi:hypothetical protein
MTPQRQTVIEVLRIHRLDGAGTVKAFVDIRLNGDTIKGAQIVQQDASAPGSRSPRSNGSAAGLTSSNSRKSCEHA